VVSTQSTTRYARRLFFFFFFLNTSFCLYYLVVYMYHEQDSLYPGHIGVTEEIKWMYRPSGF
jgi:hypothetical protein